MGRAARHDKEGDTLQPTHPHETGRPNSIASTEELRNRIKTYQQWAEEARHREFKSHSELGEARREIEQLKRKLHEAQILQGEE